MSDWDAEIPKCFGPEDLVFARTADQLASAWKLRAELLEERVSPGLLVSSIEDWLHTQTSNTGQLYEQMMKVRSFFEG